MSSSSKLPSIEEIGDESILNYNDNLLENDAEEDDVDEEEDIDFNPFLKDSPSLEASSSLSSDIEVLEDDVTGPGQECSRGEDEFGKKETRLTPPSTSKKRKSVLISQHEMETYHNRENCESSGTDIVNVNVAGDTAGVRNSSFEDFEDAISKRTRARYSLASFTLDELETFLQETDDEDDLHNVDDEEEYKKFLTAVLQGGDDDSQIRQGNDNVEEEDEENDADFELELEEALESDLEENCGGDIQHENGCSRRPETRLNKRQKASDKKTSRNFGHSNRSLRPLLPNMPVATFPKIIPKTAPRGVSTPVHNYSVGFTPEQLVQLHCLIHEHVQLLIQVFSLTIIDPSRQHVASQVKDLISSASQKRDQVTSWKRAQYPFFLFNPYSHPSVPSGHTQPSTSAFVNGPILSVLDVAPLALAGNYMDEVSIAVHECQRRRVESSSPVEQAKEPLFPFDNSQNVSEDGAGAVGGSTEAEPPKKTLAAVLVEKTKKQSIALVPKEIAGLARRFLSIFNPVLFPHKPPPAAVANRVLFTDSEDELLALGLMEFNSDWKAIQQRYLPSKSKHQIFVRQKNRSSSKAADNSIKAVRKIKSSPLTEEEIVRIQEGLKVFKLDWMSVWRYVVPYRDPSLLPRQWRIANGTQKSYKTSDEKNARRRLCAFNRKRKPAPWSGWQPAPEKEECQTDNAGGENNSGDDCMGKEDDAYVHEAFLADWRPATSIPNSSSLPFSNLMERQGQPSGLLLQSGSHFIKQVNNRGQTNSHIAASDTTFRHASSQLIPRPYLSNKNKNVRVVRLAPDLPPVNLPASVRVISQSAFVNNNTRTEVSVKSSSERSNTTQPPGETHVLKAKCDAKDKNQSDLQMHPLLFQVSGDPNLPYYPLGSRNSTSSSFNFFPPFPPQLNSSICSPHLANQAANHLNTSSKESISALGMDFHPLLQRIDDAASDLVAEHQFPQSPANSELFGISSARLHTASRVDNSSPGNISKSFSFNEVDLDIHLSLSRSEFGTGSRDVAQSCEKPFSALFQNETAGNLDSGIHGRALSGDGISLSAISVGDHSLPGIVMEQEELSDSDEEIGEHVEFECEEMDDSEGEDGSDLEQIKGLSNSREIAEAASGKQKISDALSLNLNSFPKNNSKSSSVRFTGLKHPTEKTGPSSRPTRLCKKRPSTRNHMENLRQEEELSPILNLLALNPLKGPRRTLHRNKSSNSETSSLGQGVLDLNAKARDNTGLSAGRSGKAYTNLDTNASVEKL